MGIGILVKIKFNIIASLYDYNPNLAAFMKVGDLFFSMYKDQLCIFIVWLVDIHFVLVIEV